MRFYAGFQNWPKDGSEAHMMLINAWHHLKNREAKEFETLDARVIINHAQIAVSAALDSEAA